MTPGPPPKGPEHRRRRNVPAGGEWVDLHPLDEPVLQPLPRREKGAWSARARETWETWRGDPATAQWTAADTHYALATLRLIDLNELEPRTSLASEIRLRLDGLGLTPKGKRNLRWRIAESAEVLQHSLGGSSAGAGSSTPPTGAYLTSLAASGLPGSTSAGSISAKCANST